jgi:hypothetical protein
VIGARSGQLHWLENDGGPLLVAPKAPAPLWEGGELPSRGRVVEAEFRYDTDVATDYDRACDVRDSARLLEAGGSWVLVLGGVVEKAAWWPVVDRSVFAVVTVEWLPDTSPAALATLYAAQPLGAWKLVAPEVEVGSGDLVLMHGAGRPGREDERPYDTPGPSHIGKAITFPAAPGRYRIEVCNSRVDEDPGAEGTASFIRFSRTSP